MKLQKYVSRGGCFKISTFILFFIRRPNQHYGLKFLKTLSHQSHFTWPNFYLISSFNAVKITPLIFFGVNRKKNIPLTSHDSSILTKLSLISALTHWLKENCINSINVITKTMTQQCGPLRRNISYSESLRINLKQD